MTYPDGAMLILESDLAKDAVLGEPRPTSYNDPPPPPPHGGRVRTANRVL